MSQAHNVVEAWLNNVAYSHSRSKETALAYRYHLKLFCDYASTSPEGIIKEYEGADDRKFKMKYAQLLQDWISSMVGKYAQYTIVARLTAIRSFFKYRSLPLAFVPEGANRVTFHNRGMSKDEIKTLLAESKAREGAFCAFMIQSGCRPGTIGHLHLKNLEPDWSKGTVPCRVIVPEEDTKGEYACILTFIGDDALHYLRRYFKTRGPLPKDSFLFVNRKGEPMERTLISHLFQDTLRRLRAKGAVNYETKTEGKPSELRLYGLRKYFRQQAAPAGADYVNYWMGHKLSGVDSHYFPGKGTDITEEVVEHHRKVYAEKALPNLRLESSTPTEAEKRNEELLKKYGVLEKRLEDAEEKLKDSERTRDKDTREQMILLETLNRAAEMREKHQPHNLEQILADVKQEEIQRQADMDKFIVEHPEYVWRQEGKIPMEHVQKVTRAFNEYRKEIEHAHAKDTEN